MTIMHFSFFTGFTLGLMGLAFHRTHLLSALLCLEAMMLSLFLGLSLWTSQWYSLSFATAPMLVLTLSACEAGAGLAILVATTRTHGSDNLHNLNLLQC